MTAVRGEGPRPRGLQLALDAHQQGRAVEALRLYRLFLAVRPDDLNALNLAGIAAIQAGANEAAVEFLGRAVNLGPGVADTHYNLGVALTRLRRLDEAEAACRRALALSPGHTGAKAALRDGAASDTARAVVPASRDLEDAVALHRAGRYGEALTRYRRVLASEPGNVDALNLGGVALVQTGDAEAALELLEQAAGSAPERADVHDNLGRALAELGRFKASAAAFRRAVALAPDDAQSHNNLGRALTELGEVDQAETALRRAVVLKADWAVPHNNLGALLLNLGRLDEALEAIRRALDIEPDYAAAFNNLGAVYRDGGKIDDAAAAFRRAIDIDPDHADTYGNFFALKTHGANAADISAMHGLLTSPTATERSARVLCFALASAYESLGDYDRSFEFLERGNRLKRVSIDYDGDIAAAKCASVMAVFDRELLARSAGHGSPSRAPIFIVGMPRSGTTLVEQILASHSEVDGLGEIGDLMSLVDALKFHSDASVGYPGVVPRLAPDALRELGERYVAAVHRGRPAAARFTDKLLDNFMHVGFIHLILPDAKIVHCRRDPVDTCLSCYKIEFEADGCGFAYDLSELGRRYRTYDRLMRHWTAMLPGRVLEISYEDLVANQQAQTRRLLEYCQLPWEDRCMTFHTTERAVRTASAAQVRKPIYRSAVGRWKHYERHLAPLFEALGQEA